MRVLGFEVPSAKVTSFLLALTEIGFPYAKATSQVKNGPQQGTKNYYFIITAQAAMLEDALNNACEVNKLFSGKISQVAGPRIPLPVKRTSLKNPRLYLPLEPLIKTLLGALPENVGGVFSAPIEAPILSHNGQYYSLPEYKSILEFFFRLRLRRFRQPH